MLQGVRLTGFGLAAVLAAAPAMSQQSRITANDPGFHVLLNGTEISITREGAACPPACVQPMQAAPEIATIGELEVLAFLDAVAAKGTGLLVDARLPDGFAAATLPGAVNVPAATLVPGNPYRDDLLAALGVHGGDFSEAFDLVIFAGGPDSPDAPQALRSLLDAGYPGGKLKYYRGGVQAWTALGLSTAAGQ
ncbi:rhodanese-like domain-containing protein [Salipiger sp. P9]|uniref:rhodanese-like domain-containing protein n=1 Tax=Salipiger pentaromativorans TaxID=2943193 RepID=UPI0021587604|nr:rhodanese-like domain-containing protein [Salipiger pentaromativorans]MCR8549052.1 rhodanese-like domain-containing protein [Salipiger pentaromativorans]